MRYLLLILLISTSTSAVADLNYSWGPPNAVKIMDLSELAKIKIDPKNYSPELKYRLQHPRTEMDYLQEELIDTKRELERTQDKLAEQQKQLDDRY